MKLWMAPLGLHVEMANAHHTKAMAKLHALNFFQGWSETDFSLYLSKPHVNPVYVACDKKNQVAGFMVLSLGGEECELLSIGVSQKWQGKGVGEAILQAGFDDLMNTQIAAMYLEVEQTNTPAIGLYKKFGFEETGKRQGYYPLIDGTRATALVMRANFD